MSSKSYREEIQERYGILVPDDRVIIDMPDMFVYRAENDVVVGFNRCVETFWRNRDIDDTKAE